MIEILNEVMDTLRFFLLLYVLFAEKLEWNRKRLILIVGTYAVVFTVLVSLGMEGQLYILGTLTQIGMAALLLKEKWYEKILSFLLLFSLPGVLEISLEVIYKYTVGVEPFEGPLEISYGTIGRFLSLLLVVLTVYIRSKIKAEIYISNTSRLLLSVITFSFLFTLIWITDGKNRIDHVSSLLLSICADVVVLIGIWILIIDSSRRKLRINAERAKQYLSYIEQLEAGHEEIRKIYHDLKRHLNALNHFATENDIDGIKGYLKSIGIELSENYEDAQYTENRLFNAILADKKKMAEELDITIQFEGVLHCESSVNDYDLTIVVSNLLDNAIEYVSQNGFKKIEVGVFQDENSIVIRVANPIKSDEEVQIGKSSKKHPELHGYGLMNVKRVAEKYSGMLELIVEDGTFTAKVLLMN